MPEPETPPEETPETKIRKIFREEMEKLANEREAARKAKKKHWLDSLFD